MVNHLLVCLAVLRLAAYAYDAPTAVDIAAASTTATSTQVLVASSADPVDIAALVSGADAIPTSTLTPMPQSVPSAIEYRITGTAAHCSATYENATGGTSQSGVAVPFTYTWNAAKPGAFLYMSCQIDTAADHGELVVAIYKNGVLYKSASANAFPSSATASGSY
jgi:hypothetical protein